MDNFKSNGSVIKATAPYAVDSGEGALIGSIFGVAVNTLESGEVGEFLTEGVVDLARTTGSSSAWTEGAPIYWDDSAKAVTKTNTSDTLIGYGVLPLPVDADTTGRVRLIPAAA